MLKTIPLLQRLPFLRLLAQSTTAVQQTVRHEEQVPPRFSSRLKSKLLPTADYTKSLPSLATQATLTVAAGVTISTATIATSNVVRSEPGKIWNALREVVRNRTATLKGMPAGTAYAGVTTVAYKAADKVGNDGNTKTNLAKKALTSTAIETVVATPFDLLSLMPTYQTILAQNNIAKNPGLLFNIYGDNAAGYKIISDKCGVKFEGDVAKFKVEIHQKYHQDGTAKTASEKFPFTAKDLKQAEKHLPDMKVDMARMSRTLMAASITALGRNMIFHFKQQYADYNRRLAHEEGASEEAKEGGSFFESAQVLFLSALLSGPFKTMVTQATNNAFLTNEPLQKVLADSVYNAVAVAVKAPKVFATLVGIRAAMLASYGVILSPDTRENIEGFFKAIFCPELKDKAPTAEEKAEMEKLENEFAARSPQREGFAMEFSDDLALMIKVLMELPDDGKDDIDDEVCEQLVDDMSGQFLEHLVQAMSAIEAPASKLKLVQRQSLKVEQVAAAK